MKILAIILSLMVIVGVAAIARIWEEDQRKQLRRSKQVRRRRLPNPPRKQLLLPGTTLKQQEEEQQRQQQEQKRQEQKAARRVREALKRQEAESQRRAAAKTAAEAARAAAEERARSEHVLTQWKQERLTKKPTPVQITAAIEESNSVQSHCGDYLHVIALIETNGVALEWKVQPDTPCVPTVIGVRNDAQMFVERAYTGRHAARLSPGRYVLEFMVYSGGCLISGDPDVCFEIFIPDRKSRHGADQFKQAVNTTAKEFVNRAKTVANAKQKVSKTLAAQGTDPDEIEVEMSKLDYEIKDLQNDG